MIDEGQRTQTLGSQSEANHGACVPVILSLISDRTRKSSVMPQRSEFIISQARERIARIRATLNGMDYLCSGTLLERMKICGKPGCRCAQDPQARHGP
jgi:hypothetical protein